MSAYVVDKAHINVLVNAGMGRDPLYWYHNDEGHQLTNDNADAVGQMLLDENVKAVSIRYPDEDITDLPGRADAEYLLPFVHQLMYPVSTVQVLKLIDCYEYQASEDPEYDTTEAAAFCRYLRKHMITRLPGYDDAEWEWVKWPEERLHRLV